MASSPTPSTPEEIQPYRPHLLPDTSIRPVGPVSSTPSDIEAQNEKTLQPDPSSFPGRPPGLHPLAIPPLTIRQKLYIILPQMIGAAILDGVANFGIGCAMYLNAKNVRIWILKNNTVAGDMAITIFIQGVLTFCIASGMVHVDLRKNKISAFPCPWPDTAWGAAKRLPTSGARTRLGRLWRTFHNNQGFSRGLHFFSGSDVNDIFDSRLSRAQFFQRLCWSIWKGSVLSVIYFFIMWPISMAIVAPIWEHDNLGGKFTAPLIKGVYGAVYGLLMNPVCAMIAMGSEDSVRYHRAERQREHFEHPEKEAMKTTAAERVTTAAETHGLLRGPSGSPPDLSTPLQPVDGPARRVESLRRSLDTVGSRAHGYELDVAAARGEGGPALSGLGWRAADVHRRRSLDAPRRASHGRYSAAPHPGALARSASSGSANTRPTSQPSGLFGPSGELGRPVLVNESHRHQGHTYIPPMRRLTEHSTIHE